MQAGYAGALEKINDLRDCLKLTFDHHDPNSDDEKRVYREMEGLIDSLDLTGTTLNRYLQQKAIEESLLNGH